MSIAPKALRRLYDKGELQVWVWSVKAGDELEQLGPGYGDITVQVSGTFGGAGIVIDGSLDGDNFTPLSRALGERPVIKSPTIALFPGPVPFIKPRLIGGDETTNLTIMVAAVQK